MTGMPSSIHFKKLTLRPKYPSCRKKPIAITLVVVPIGVVIPPTLDAYAAMSSSAVPYLEREIVCLATDSAPWPCSKRSRICSAIGNTIAVAAVLEMNIDINPTHSSDRQQHTRWRVAHARCAEHGEREAPIEAMPHHGEAQVHAPHQKEERRLAEPDEQHAEMGADVFPAGASSCGMPKKKHKPKASSPVAGIGIGSVIHHRIVRIQTPSNRSAGVTAKPGIVSQTIKNNGPRIKPQKSGRRHGVLIFRAAS